MGEVIALQPRVGEAQMQLDAGAVDAVLYQFPGVALEIESDLSMAAGAEDVSYFGVPYSASQTTDNLASVHLLHEAVETDDLADISGEVYGGSLRFKRALGEVAVKDLLDTPEGWGAYTEDFDDFHSGIGEMLKTAEGLRSIVEVNRVKAHNVRDDRVLAGDDKTFMDDLVETGERSARGAVEVAVKEGDKLSARIMGVQAERDASDVWNVHRVNGIVAGKIEVGGRIVNRRTVVSMFPQERMDLDGDKPWTDLKYMRGLAYIQDYYFDGKKVIASTYSISFADKDKLRGYLNKKGFSIPEDAHTSDWVRHGREETLEASENPDSSLQELRRGYYDSIGKKGPKYSVETLMEAKEETIVEAFDTLNLPFTESLVSGKKHKAIHEFASQLLAYGEVFAPEVRKGLMRIVARGNFDDTDGRLMDELIKYSVADTLQSFVKKAKKAGRSIEEHMVKTKQKEANSPVVISFSQRMANQTIEGARAGRSYGGCPGKKFKISDSPETPDDEANSQEAFGGKGTGNEEEEVYIPPQIRCIKCRRYSPREKVVQEKYWCCPKCSYKIDVCNGEELHASDVDSKQESGAAAAGAVILDFITKLEEKRKAA